jgi:hypothetical protein
MSFFSILDVLGKVASSFMTLLALFTLIFGYKAKLKGGFINLIREIVGIQEVKECIDKGSQIIKTQSETSEKLQGALLCVLRKEIKDICDGCIEKQYITNDELEMLTQEFESYRILDGNSFIHNLVGKVNQLPVKNE